MEYTFNNDTNITDILSKVDGETTFVITVDAECEVEKVKDLLTQVSNLSDFGFKFFNIRLKALSTDKKVEVLKFAIANKLCITSIIETVVLLINSSNNYNPEFFEADDVLFSSVVDYLDVCDMTEEEVTKVREDIAFYFLATLKSYVNHPRFMLNASGNYETVPAFYECVLMLLDFFNISFILNTPGLKVPGFNEIPNNIKSEIKLLDLWADKQKFVVSTLSELSKLVNDKIMNETPVEE